MDNINSYVHFIIELLLVFKVTKYFDKNVKVDLFKLIEKRENISKLILVIF